MEQTGIPLREDGLSDNWLVSHDYAQGPVDLQVVHVTQAGLARKIIRDGVIDVRVCNVFTKEKLVYFFVLRPDYKSHTDTNIDSQIDHFPAALILSSKSLPLPRRVMPFDSGAAYSGYFDRAFSIGASRHLRLQDYMLLPDMRAVSAFIDRMFGSEHAYFRGELKAELKADAIKHGQGVQSYVAIASVPTEGKNEPDMRASAIELAFGQAISLKGNLKAVVLPDSFRERVGDANEDMRKKLRALNIKPMTYPWQANVTPESRRAEMRLLIEKYLFKSGHRVGR